MLLADELLDGPRAHASRQRPGPAAVLVTDIGEEVDCRSPNELNGIVRQVSIRLQSSDRYQLVAEPLRNFCVSTSDEAASSPSYNCRSRHRPFPDFPPCVCFCQ